jgi:integrase
VASGDYEMAVRMAVQPDTVPPVPRREYGSGSVYQRARDKKWVGTLDVGWTARGTRRRISVIGKTEAEVKRKLRDKRLAIERGRKAAPSNRTTVKQWADEWLDITQHDLTPKAWGTNAGQVRKWIVPTIGHVRLAEVSHADVRAVASAQRNANPPQALSSITRCKAVLLKMLKDAATEGHYVPPEVVAVQPKKKKRKRKDPAKRAGLPLPDVAAVFAVTRGLPHHSRWDMAFMQGLRQGEALGLTWECVDLDTGLLDVSWQLQALPYREARDPSSGFRVPDDYEARHLWKAFHLVRPKTEAGERTIPLVEWAVSTLAEWRDIAPANPHGLVWTRPDGRPIDKHSDLEEWKAIQRLAGIAHPSGRPYVGHEIRNTTATILAEMSVEDYIVTAILGHTDIETSRAYVTRRAQQARPAMEAVARALGLS